MMGLGKSFGMRGGSFLEKSGAITAIAFDKMILWTEGSWPNKGLSLLGLLKVDGSKYPGEFLHS